MRSTFLTGEKKQFQSITSLFFIKPWGRGSQYDPILQAVKARLWLGEYLGKGYRASLCCCRDSNQCFYLPLQYLLHKYTLKFTKMAEKSAHRTIPSEIKNGKFHIQYYSQLCKIHMCAKLDLWAASITSNNIWIMGLMVICIFSLCHSVMFQVLNYKPSNLWWEKQFRVQNSVTVLYRSKNVKVSVNKISESFYTRYECNKQKETFLQYSVLPPNTLTLYTSPTLTHPALDYRSVFLNFSPMQWLLCLS